MQLQQPLIIIVILVLQPGSSPVCPSFSSPLHSFRCLFLYLLISSGLHLLGFLDKIYFTGWGSQPNAQPQTCRSGLCIYSVILSVLDPRECEYLRLFIRFWTCIYDHISCFMRSMSILVCRSLKSWRHRDNDWRLAPCRPQPCHCVVR